MTRLIETLSDLLKIAHEILNVENGLLSVAGDEVHRFPLIWYRGQGDASWALQPSIERGGRGYEMERYYCNRFYNFARPLLDDPPPKDDETAWLALAQHHWVPTRLLDWSSSPLVALWFAINECFDETAVNRESVKDKDAAVWVLLPRLLNANQINEDRVLPSDSRTINAMTAKAFGETRDIHVFNGMTEQEKNAMQYWVKNKIAACHSVDKHMRMYKQQSQFTVHNHVDGAIVTLETLFTVNSESENVLHKLTVPKDAKEHLFNDLRTAGFSWSYFFPDLDNIGKDIRYTYKK